MRRQTMRRIMHRNEKYSGTRYDDRALPHLLQVKSSILSSVRRAKDSNFVEFWQRSKCNSAVQDSSRPRRQISPGSRRIPNLRLVPRRGRPRGKARALFRDPGQPLLEISTVPWRYSHSSFSAPLLTCFRAHPLLS